MSSSGKCMPISVILYQDAFEVVNPIGSAKSKHKVLGVYMILGNLLTHNRSKIDHTQLVLLCLEKDFDKFGQNLVFRRLVNDLKLLECEGVAVSWQTENLPVTVAAITGDNLGSHCIGGFTKNFSNGEFICRTCTLTRPEFLSGTLSATPELIRTPSSYDLVVEKLERAEEVNTIVISSEGIKFRSIFNELSTFQVCQAGLPPCLAHDLFEGVVAYDVPLLLKCFIKAKFLTVDTLNRKIQTFQLQHSDANVRPAALSIQMKRLSGSGRLSGQTSETIPSQT